MRTFEDKNGNRWQAAVLDASFGNAVLVFSPMGGGDVLKHALYAANLAEAEQTLAAMDEAELKSTLAQATAME